MPDLKSLIREVPDFPKPGINFYDITTLLKDPRGWHDTIDAMTEHYRGRKIDVVVGVEARGFFFAPAIPYALCAGLVPVPKPGKPPAAQVEVVCRPGYGPPPPPTVSVEYALEYGTDTLHMHEDAIEPGAQVLIIDDVLATGGTAVAVAELVEKSGGKVVGLGFLVELDFLHGRNKLAGRDLFTVLHY